MPPWITRIFYQVGGKTIPVPVWALGIVPTAPFGYSFTGLGQFAHKHLLTSTELKAQAGPLVELQSTLRISLLSGTQPYELPSPSLFQTPAPSSQLRKTARLHRDNPSLCCTLEISAGSGRLTPFVAPFSDYCPELPDIQCLTTTVLGLFSSLLVVSHGSIN